VRTTIRIDDDLYRQVKAKTARRVRTVAAVLDDAVRQGISPSEQSSRGRYVVRRPAGEGFGPAWISRLTPLSPR
jgi:predicted transcriptional regulator